MVVKKLLTGFYLLLGLSVLAQPKPSAVTDKAEILIGEQFKLKLSASFTTNDFNANGFVLPDSIRHFEIIEKGLVDSSLNNGLKSLTQTITLTSFDSGAWEIPPVALLTHNKASLSDPIIIKVGFDSTKIKDLNDIKTIIDTKVNTGWMYWAVGIVTMLALIGFVIYLYKTKLTKQDTKKEEIITSKRSALDEALESLKHLNERTIVKQEDMKMMHTDLTGVLKRYLLRANNINVFKSTTDEVLLKLKDNLITQAQLSSVAEILRLNDAVKFAGYFPSPGESKAAIGKMEQIIHLLNKIKAP